MAGSGRIAVPLAEEGHEITAVDLDLAMLARARVRAEAAGPETVERLTLVAADVATPGPSAGQPGSASRSWP